MSDELNLLILDKNEDIIGTLDPEIVEITEINDYGGIRYIEVDHPTVDEKYDYDVLLKHGNKIYCHHTLDDDSCMYVINSDKTIDNDMVSFTAEEVIVELNNAPPLINLSSNAITVNSTNLNAWFGNYYTIGTVQVPSKTINWVGTISGMELIRLIEDKTGYRIQTRYSLAADGQTIRRYMDLLESIGVQHVIPVELGENTDSIEIKRTEEDTYTAMAPIIQAGSGAKVDDIIITTTAVNNFRNLAVNVGDTIPMIIEKGDDGSEVVKATWSAPFKKDAGSLLVYATGTDTSDYTDVYYKEGSSSKTRKTGLMETTETNKYIIYNNLALKLKEKIDPAIIINADINDLHNFTDDSTYKIGDWLPVRVPKSNSPLNVRVVKTEKDPRKTGFNKITLGNAVVRSFSSPDIKRGESTPTEESGSIIKAIPAYADLNTYIATGVFVQTSNVNAANGTNYPAPYAGLLEVHNGGAGLIWQRYTTYLWHNIAYWRSSSGGAWTSWKQILTDNGDRRTLIEAKNITSSGAAAYFDFTGLNGDVDRRYQLEANIWVPTNVNERWLYIRPNNANMEVGGSASSGGTLFNLNRSTSEVGGVNVNKTARLDLMYDILVGNDNQTGRTVSIKGSTTRIPAGGTDTFAAYNLAGSGQFASNPTYIRVGVGVGTIYGQLRLYKLPV